MFFSYGEAVVVKEIKMVTLIEFVVGMIFILFLYWKRYMLLLNKNVCLHIFAERRGG